jgi:hypothetical protein
MVFGPFVFAQFGLAKHLPSMTLELLTLAFERFTAAPIALSFQSMPLLFQKLPSANLVPSNLLLALWASRPSFLGSRCGEACGSDDQNRP